MKSLFSLKKLYRYIPSIVGILLILLFTYAASSKILDHEEFRIQLGQSPVLSAYADILMWGVPLTELLVVFTLIIPSLRLIGLYGSLILLCQFTTYIIVILNFADYIPCSCGGVLENLGWKAHLIFNLAFVFLSICGIWMSKLNSGSTF